MATDQVKHPTRSEHHEYSFALDTAKINKEIKDAYQSAHVNIDTALYNLDKLYVLSKIKNHQLGEADALFYTGMIYTNQRSEPDKAIKYYWDSYKIYEGLHLRDSMWYFDWLTDIGAAYVVKWNTDSAIYYYEEALRMAVRQPQFGGDGLGSIYNNLGLLLMRSNDFDKALFYFKKNEEINMRLKENRNLVGVWQSMAGCYAYKSIYDSALFYAKKVDGLRLPFSEAQAETQHRLLGFIYAQKKDFKESIRHYKICLNINDKNSARRDEIFLGLGSSYLAEHQYANAEKYLHKALLEYAPHKNAGISVDRTIEINTHKALANLYDSLSDYKRAYYHRSKGYLISDSSHAEGNEEIVQRMEAQYRIAEKDKEVAETKVKLLAAIQSTQKRNIWLATAGCAILLLSLMFLLIFQRQRLVLQRVLSNTQKLRIDQLQASIEAEERERKRIGHQLHDEVMVEFSIVKMNMAALLEQNNYIQQLPDYLQVFQQLDTACIKLRHSAHNLIPDGLMEEGLIAAINYFCNKVQANIPIRIQFEHFGILPLLTPEKSVNIYRIIQELIQNVIKHAKATELLVQVSYQNSHLFIIVEDNGIGIPEGEQPIEGMGLKSIRLRVKAMNGCIQIQPVTPYGMSVQIEMEISK